ncbi:MAG: DUF2007 domain-containing protein [Anaerolineales bacterium]|nr:DUF2007 domain-containing protein [Anaerolineales bacterium]HUS84055.1 hypothetical protein [Anaerolineales bacterium]
MVDNFVVVESASGILEAEIIKGMLEAQEIDVVLSYEAAAAIYGFGVGRSARVEILVPKEMLGEAQKCLEDYNTGRLVDETEESDQG